MLGICKPQVLTEESLTEKDLKRNVAHIDLFPGAERKLFDSKPCMLIRSLGYFVIDIHCSDNRYCLPALN